jgi:hypothetical protein
MARLFKEIIFIFGFLFNLINNPYDVIKMPIPQKNYIL